MDAEAPVRKQVGRGVAALFMRTAVLTPVSFAASVLLARWLPPADFGTFVSVAFLVLGFGSLFELGLISVLVQQREAPTVQEQRTVFTAYAALFSVLAAAIAGAAPWLAEAFRLPSDGAAMLRWMTLPMLLGVLGSVPTVLLERDLRFGVITVADIGGVLLEKGLTLWLAYHGHGAWSFVWGALGAVVLRLVVLNAMAPWPLGLAWDRELLRRQLGRGIWFQGTNLAHLARENLNTLLAGPASGPHSVGLLNWSANLTSLVPAQAIQVASRVTFPAWARLQDSPIAAAELLRLTLRRLLLVAVPPLACLLALSEAVIRHLYGEAWLEALPLLGWGVLRMLSGLVFSPLLVFLNARGEGATAFRCILGSTLLEWGLASGGLMLAGVTGVAAGAALGTVPPVLWLALRVARTAPLRPLATFGPGLGLALALGGLAWSLAPLIGSLATLLAAAGLLVVAWGGGLAWLERAWLGEALAEARRRFPGSSDA